MYKIITDVVPLSLAGVLNQIWTVWLLLFQSTIIDQENLKKIVKKIKHQNIKPLHKNILVNEMTLYAVCHQLSAYCLKK